MFRNISAVAYKTSQNKTWGQDKMRLLMLYGTDFLFVVAAELCTDISMKRNSMVNFQGKGKNTLKSQRVTSDC